MCTVHTVHLGQIKSQFVIFGAKTTTYFVLKNYTLIEYNILYIIVLFLEFFEVSEFKFFGLQNSSTIAKICKTSYNLEWKAQEK
jgi:hypothetical protein